MKNLKLWEAIGLLLVLSSWCLEWSSVQKWDDAEDNYWRFVTTFQDAAIKLNDQVRRQFELSINRSVNGMRLDPQDFASAYKLAWDYAEVRKLWLERAFSGLYRADTLIKGLLEFKKKYNLDVKEDLDALEKSSKAIGNELAKSVNKQDPTSRIVPIPTKEEVSLIQAGNIDNRIQKLVSDLITPINEVAIAMKAKRNFWSLVFRTLFAVGSLILIFAKICEWWKKRQDGRPNK